MFVDGITTLKVCGDNLISIRIVRLDKVLKIMNKWMKNTSIEKKNEWLKNEYSSE